jgi:hypothetical protein
MSQKCLYRLKGRHMFRDSALVYSKLQNLPIFFTSNNYDFVPTTLIHTSHPLTAAFPGAFPDLIGFRMCPTSKGNPSAPIHTYPDNLKTETVFIFSFKQKIEEI